MFRGYQTSDRQYLDTNVHYGCLLMVLKIVL